MESVFLALLTSVGRDWGPNQTPHPSVTQS